MADLEECESMPCLDLRSYSAQALKVSNEMQLEQLQKIKTY